MFCVFMSLLGSVFVKVFSREGVLWFVGYVFVGCVLCSFDFVW